VRAKETEVEFSEASWRRDEEVAGPSSCLRCLFLSSFLPASPLHRWDLFLASHQP